MNFSFIWALGAEPTEASEFKNKTQTKKQWKPEIFLNVQRVCEILKFAEAILSRN